MKNDYLQRTQTYIKSLDADTPRYLQELEREARKNYVPVIRHETQSLLRMLISIVKPSRVLEIGSAVGFSAMLMSEYMPPGGRIITIEHCAKRAEIARCNFKKNNKTDVIELIEGEATNIVAAMEEPFDFIFLDSAKAQYVRMLPHLVRLLKTGGVMVSDNVFHDGVVLESRFVVDRRDRTIHTRMRKFLYEITHSDALSSSVLSCGDGVAICYRKK